MTTTRDTQMHILILIVKDFGTLDYVTPLVWKIKKQYPWHRITVLYCVRDKARILKGSRFYSDLFRELGVKEGDLNDFAPRHLKALDLMLGLTLKTTTALVSLVSLFGGRLGRAGPLRTSPDPSHGGGIVASHDSGRRLKRGLGRLYCTLWGILRRGVKRLDVRRPLRFFPR